MTKPHKSILDIYDEIDAEKVTDVEVPLERVRYRPKTSQTLEQDEATNRFYSGNLLEVGESLIDELNESFEESNVVEKMIEERERKNGIRRS